MWKRYRERSIYNNCGQGSPNREPAGFLNRKYRTGIPVKPTGIPIGDFYQVW
jgi:hypothetical protein